MRLRKIAIAAICCVCMPVFANARDIKNQKQIIIILDPGHGGRDRGGEYNGFKWMGSRVPEDPYTYDVAKRVERLLAGSPGVQTVLTVFDPDGRGVTDSDENHILAPLKNLVYNDASRTMRVLHSKAGLLKRVRISDDAKNKHPGAVAIFIALHFNSAPDYIAGATIYASAGSRSHPFTSILADEFKKGTLQPTFRGSPKEAIVSNNKYVVLINGLFAPRLLVELGNFKNSQDRLAMLRSDGREKYAAIIVAAVNRYVESFVCR
jgi:N-acetylmuramoyl-L-alanine amidase